MSKPELFPDFRCLSVSEAKLLNDSYLQQEVKDEFTLSFARDLALKESQTPS